MIEKGSRRFEALAETIDVFTTLDLTGVGLVRGLFEAAVRLQGGPMCLKAAEAVVAALKEGGGPALISTGFPEGGGIPETDGPVGAAMLARALWFAFETPTIIVTDEGWEGCVRATCTGGGMAPLALPDSGEVPKIELLRPVFIKTVPKDWQRARDLSDALLETARPAIMFAIERPGMNRHGVYHGMSGRVLDDLVADLDHMFHRGRELGIPSVAFGDGGNELGTGVLREDLPALLPKAADCGCPCHGGIGADTVADRLVVASVSNWAVTGLIAALALLQGNPGILHEAETEFRSIDLCTANGGVDGLSMSPEVAVDGIAATEWRGLIRAMKGLLLRGMGLNSDWRQLV